jgi:hypothetical protein
MRLRILIGLGLTMSLGVTTPAMSQPSIHIKPQFPEIQAPTNGESNSRQLKVNTYLLLKNSRLWNRQDISNYRYTLSNSCFCLPEARGPVVIEVRNGQTTSIISVATKLPVSNPEFFQQYNTIPKLFRVIRDAINLRADSINVEYEPTLGYPTDISIDYLFQAADEELFLTITNFEEIE